MIYSANSARSSTTFGLRGNVTSCLEAGVRRLDGEEWRIPWLYLVMFRHCLPIVNKQHFQNLRHIKLHLRFLAALLLSKVETRY